MPVRVRLREPVLGCVLGMVPVAEHEGQGAPHLVMVVGEELVGRGIRTHLGDKSGQRENVYARQRESASRLSDIGPDLRE